MYRIRKIASLVSPLSTTIITVGTFFLPTKAAVYVSEIPNSLKYIIIIFLVLCNVLSSSRKGLYKSHIFKFRSKRFIKFFTNWYSQSGTISIVCDDLGWTAEGEEKSIYNALCKKAQDKALHLYLGNKNDGLARELKRLGAEVKVRPDSVSNYAFSCVEIMGNRTGKMIVRDKQNDPSGIIIFEERGKDKVFEVLLESVVEYANVNANSKKR